MLDTDCGLGLGARLKAKLRGLLLGLLIVAALPGLSHADTFAPGAIILPSDVVWQDDGGFEIYGLVHALLRADVPVHWSIETPKPVGGTDFTAFSSPWNGTTSANRAFSGGPWIVAPEDVAPETLDLIDTWLLSHPDVNLFVADQSFTAPINRTLTSAPSIAVLADGGLSTVADYLNAASILDDQDQPWPTSVPPTGSPSFPHVLTESSVIGPSTLSVVDGSLWESSGFPYYLTFSSGRWSGPAPTGFDTELRNWNESPYVHGWFASSSIAAVESFPSGGFLTTAGVQNGGTPGPAVYYVVGSHPLVQFSPPWGLVGGPMQSVQLSSWGSYVPFTEVYIRKLGVQKGLKDILSHGYVDGNPNQGLVTYLAGVGYSTASPLSLNHESAGVRSYLNSLLMPPLLRQSSSPEWTLDITSPPTSATTQFQVSASWWVDVDGISSDSLITVLLPPGLSFISADSGGSYDAAAHSVQWFLDEVLAGTNGLFSLLVEANSEGSYEFDGEVSWRVGWTEKTTPSSGSSSTVVILGDDDDSAPPGDDDDDSAPAGDDDEPDRTGPSSISPSTCLILLSIPSTTTLHRSHPAPPGQPP